MKRILSLILFATMFFTANAQSLDLIDITSGEYGARGVQSVMSAADGEHYYQANASNTQIIKYEYKTGEAVATVFDVATARDCDFSSFQGFILSPDEHRLLIHRNAEYLYRHSFMADYYYFDIRRNMLQKLSQQNEKQSVPVFSRDGRMAAYVVNNNIWLARFDFGSESQITTDGAYNKIINGATDWVYEEEFGTTHIMDFSADNSLLAFVRFDESEVKKFSFQTFSNQLYPSLFSFKYPKTGEANSKVSVKIFEIDNKRTRDVEIPSTDLEYIPRIEFMPTGDNLAVMTLNRNQNDFKMYSVDARSTVAREILRETNKRFVDSELLKTITFFDDKFAYLSEKDGYTHIYLHQNTGAPISQLTTGNYDVTSLLAINAKDNMFYYQAAEESPLRREVYSLNIKKNEKKKLSPKAGYNSATFSKGGKYFVHRHNNSTTPTITTMHDEKGKELRVLEANTALAQKIKSTKLPKKEFITLKAADNTTDLNAYVMKPVDFNPNKQYPVIMIQYSGPNSQQVTDSYGVDWTDYATTQGYIVACVDGRGTGARGEDFRKQTYMNLGIMESDDQIAAAKQLGALPYVDSNKIAIWGWSYGGYNVLMSMSRSEGVFASGVAIAPVTDWRFYDTVYGERFMRTPQQNMHGYNEGSPIYLANKLNGDVLLIHGSADDNVHLQNIIDYSEALIDADKQFEMFVFPDKNHSILGASTRNYLYTKVINFFNRTMK